VLPAESPFSAGIQAQTPPGTRDFGNRELNQHRFCYVLTTTGRDDFADMTYASLAFLRHSYPAAEILCLCDAVSHQVLVQSRHPLLEIVDRAQSVATPDGPPGFRNRFVKTRMRQVVEGDFVYFDSDTLVVDRLDEMLSCEAPLAGIANHNGTGDPSKIPGDERAVYDTMGWPLPRRPYINGGVLLLRDCESTRRFACLWHEKWLACSLRGNYRDQPSLNSALADSGINYQLLDNRFNGQVVGRPSICREPVAVWHLYSSESDRTVIAVPKTMLDEAVARFRADGCLTSDTVRELSRWPYPWRTPTALDRWFVSRRVLSKESLTWDSASRYWLAGQRWKAVSKFLGWHVARSQ
jgi:hypothetical protein